ncbi:indolepyruvate oxidoreductase subunit beta family protein [Paraburkholderia fungorum]|uniref:Indolepyruvate oxidoreductase subunit B n=1 Tax=Paraburkholderia fungorum TaxID=134537 RepID=A0A420GPB3_9BURK|nr:indolepyruvate oxidoreductase subunit beta family protein [Paraburkholderia fungorum]RKF47114.1 indolepyruvate oxidoreductase subunit B [Paraburkholderia fungorum]
MSERPIGIAILAMGGEGGGVLADWIVDLAEHEGYPAQTTSVPGVAQRTGATIYYVEFRPCALDAHDRAHEPVLSLVPTPGDVDIVLASELMEMGRAIQRGLVTPDRTTLIASTHRVYSMTEKTSMSDGRVDPRPFVAQAQKAAKHFVHADFARIAENNGSVISAALFGALAGANALPFSREQFEAAIKRAGVGVQSSLKAFAAGFETAVGAGSNTAQEKARLPGDAVPARRSQPFDIGAANHPEIAALDRRIQSEFPVEVADILHRAVRRLADYQDAGYAHAYLERLKPLHAADDAATYAVRGDELLLAETARHLALWMSYEDTVRVAELKIRATRFTRVRDEVKATPEQLLHINEFLHPRVEEIADTLPAALGRWLLKPGALRSMVERLTSRGRVVRTTSLRGFLMLYGVASLRGARRRSLRYQREHAEIDAWLARTLRYAARDYSLALEIARSQRLVKGYGDTHARGMRNYRKIEAVIPLVARTAAPAARLKALCEAALADEEGERLDALLDELRRNDRRTGQDSADVASATVSSATH